MLRWLIFTDLVTYVCNSVDGLQSCVSGALNNLIQNSFYWNSNVNRRVQTVVYGYFDGSRKIKENGPQIY